MHPGIDLQQRLTRRFARMGVSGNAKQQQRAAYPQGKSNHEAEQKKTRMMRGLEQPAATHHNLLTTKAQRAAKSILTKVRKVRVCATVRGRGNVMSGGKHVRRRATERR
jgi:hypothetical protein